MLISHVLHLLTLLSASTILAWADPSPECKDDIITRDICIIGGGAAGTYSAVRLRDMNQSVIVVERLDRLGGNTQTFTDPVTQSKIDIGVRVWHNTDLVKNFFARFGVSLVTQPIQGGPSPELVDFSTGKLVSLIPSDPTTAFQIYAGQLAKYPFLDDGFNLPDPVPADLLLPFGDFVNKFNISAAVTSISQICEGVGDLLKTPTLYVMKLFGLSILEAFQIGFMATADNDNSQLYEKAQASLGPDVLLNSQVIKTKRDTSGGVTIVVSTPSGPKTIKAKKIIFTAPPTLENLERFDLDNTERSLFKQFSTTGYYTGLIRNSSIPDNVMLQNTGANTPFNLPNLPGLYAIDATGVPGLLNVLYGSTTPLPVDQVKADIVASINRLNTAGTFPTTTPEFVVFENHSPFVFTVPVSAIAGGFYKRLNALQGHRQMFYTGATFQTQDSSLIWQFTEGLLPQVVA